MEQDATLGGALGRRLCDRETAEGVWRSIDSLWFEVRENRKQIRKIAALQTVLLVTVFGADYVIKGLGL